MTPYLKTEIVVCKSLSKEEPMISQNNFVIISNIFRSRFTLKTTENVICLVFWFVFNLSIFHIIYSQLNNANGLSKSPNTR